MGLTGRFYFARKSLFRIILRGKNSATGNSVEVAPILLAVEGRCSLGLPRWQGFVLVLLIAWLYASILVRLFLQWVGPFRDPNFEHGIFVPLFAFFFLCGIRASLSR